MKIPKLCRYCAGKVRKGSTKEIFESGDQPIYICTNCNAFVRCHQRTGLPMGKLANAALRMKRHETHEVFDSFWQGQGWSRTEAYRWLAENMNLAETDAHIGNFEMDECAHLIKLCNEQKQKGAA